MDKPTHYTILPAEIRYHKKLNANEKILYSEILALANNDQGYCFASNKRLSQMLDAHINSISRWIKSLKRAKVIKFSYVIENKNVEKRKIYPLTKQLRPTNHTVKTPINHTVKYTNKRYTKRVNNDEEIILGKII